MLKQQKDLKICWKKIKKKNKKKKESIKNDKKMNI